MPSASHNHLRWKLEGDYPIPQFQQLAQTVSKTASNVNRPTSRKSAVSTEAKISPRQEIYKSMIREIRSDHATQLNSLVHKASGILRLEHYKNQNKNQKVIVSWDMDGRRVLTYAGKGGASKTALQRETNFDRGASKRKLLASLNQPIFGLDFEHFKQLSNDYDSTNDTDSSINGSADCERQSTVSKLWEDYIDTGDVSKLWDSKETIISRSKRKKNRSRSSASRISDSESRISVDSANGSSPQPPWKGYTKPSRERIKCWQTNKTLWGTPELVSATSNVQTNQIKHEASNGDDKDRTDRSKRKSHSSHSRLSHRQEPDEPVERVQHICVVNGSVVSFKDFGFENFTNWFGDESVLEANQQRAQPEFHLELDLSNVETKDIKIRLLEGCKLEIEAKRRIEGSKRPLRVKDFLHIPRGYRAEDLLLCRTKAGKLVVENLTSEPIDTKKFSKTRVYTSRPKSRHSTEIKRQSKRHY